MIRRLRQEPLRSSIAIIIMIIISVLINCIHFSTLHVHENGVLRSKSMQDLNTQEGQEAQTEVSVWSGVTECKMTGKASISWNTLNMPDFSESVLVIKGLARSLWVYTVQRILSISLNFVSLCMKWRCRRRTKVKTLSECSSQFFQRNLRWKKSIISGRTGVMIEYTVC